MRAASVVFWTERGVASDKCMYEKKKEGVLILILPPTSPIPNQPLRHNKSEEVKNFFCVMPEVFILVRCNAMRNVFYSISSIRKHYCPKTLVGLSLFAQPSAVNSRRKRRPSSFSFPSPFPTGRTRLVQCLYPLLCQTEYTQPKPNQWALRRGGGCRKEENLTNIAKHSSNEIIVNYKRLGKTW